MATLRIDKVVSILPTTLEANAVYAVRVGQGFDLYVTDDNAVPSAFKLNQRHQIHRQGRFRGYSNERWVTDSDDVYGTNAQTWNENVGTAVDPIVEWEHIGHFMKAGTFIRGLTMACRANNAQWGDTEVYGLVKYPTDPNAWLTGFDNDAEISTTQVVRGNFSDSGLYTITGPGNDMRRQEWNLNFEVLQDCYLSLYVKPIGNITANRYLYTSYVWGIEV